MKQKYKTIMFWLGIAGLFTIALQFSNLSNATNNIIPIKYYLISNDQTHTRIHIPLLSIVQIISTILVLIGAKK